MKPEDIRYSFDTVAPSEVQKERMFTQIKDMSGSAAGKQYRRHWAVAVTAAACCLTLIAGIAVWALTSDTAPDIYNGEIDTDDKIPPGAGDAAGEDTAERNDMANIPALNQFGLYGRQYMRVDEYFSVERGLPLVPAEADVGEKIADITTAADSSMIGCGVYRYTKTAGEAVVAVKVKNEYLLYRFYTFDKYNANGDEDAVEYLKLYGINNASDIARIDFIRYTEQAKLENRLNVVGSIDKTEELKTFYQYYSVIKDSSAAYFEKLFNIREVITGEDNSPADSQPSPQYDLPPDYGEAGLTTGQRQPEYAEDAPAYDGREVSEGSGNAASYPGSAGSSGANLLSNQVTLRIYAKNGMYLETIYYPDMGFISRHEVTPAFAQFLAAFTG